MEYPPPPESDVCGRYDESPGSGTDEAQVQCWYLENALGTNL